MVTPRMRQQPTGGMPWAADNGRFNSPHEYSDEKYLAWLVKMEPHRDRCLFATAPDVVGDAAATLEMSAPMLPRIRALGYPVAFVAQDGLESLPVPWDDFDALFIGGTTYWKLSEHVVVLVKEARRRGKHVHMGRVNSLQRTIYAESIGCDSVDGTKLRFDPNARPDKWAEHVNANPSIWGLVDS